MAGPLRSAGEPWALQVGAWRLRGRLLLPTGQPRAVFVLHHAMMADLGPMMPLALALADAGCVALAVDSRGHGQSGPLPPAGDWTFDGLARDELPAVAAALRAQLPGLPLIAAGHSLGGQAALVAEAVVGPVYDAILVLGSGRWGIGPRDERGLLRLQRLGLYLLGAALCRIFGHLPVSRLGRWRDEARGYWLQTTGWVWRRAFDGLDGRDYAAAIAGLRLPIVALRGDRDPLVRPVDQRALITAPDAVFVEVPGADHHRLPRLCLPVLLPRLDALVGHAEAWRRARGA
ncbi:MAG: hypothetical protein RL071_3377 [Pseudomonadota bacterium]